MDNGGRRPAARADLVIAAAAVVLLVGYGLTVRQGPALADEFIYLAGARHFAETGSLDARYYDASAILRRGHPHQDVHTPGYVLVLGLVMRPLGSRWGVAVALNAIAYVASALFVHHLARALGLGDTAGRVGAGLYLVLPIYLPYVFWAMPELLLGALVLAALLAAAALGETVAGAVAAGSLYGLALLVRESAVFALPALLVLQRAHRRTRVFAATVAAWLLFVYLPLSIRRAPGGANFWDPVGGTAFGYQAVLAAGRGALGRALLLVAARTMANVRSLASGTTATELGILVAFALVPLLTCRGLRQRPELARAALLALLAGYAAVVALLFGVYVVGQWSGLRYLMFLVPPLLPFLWPPAGRRRDVVLVSALAVVVALLVVGARTIFEAYKASRQRRQANLTAYVERYLPAGGYTRVALPNGWLFGWSHPGVEVITSLPESIGEIRALERKVWFDYLALPGDSPLGAAWDERVRYERQNGAEAEAPLRIYRRLR